MTFPTQVPTLALPDHYRVTSACEDAAEITLEVQCVDLLTICPACRSMDMRSWGTRNLTYTDLPYREKKVRMQIAAKRQRCHTCKRTFLQPLPGMAQQHSMTERLRRYIGEEGRKRTFTAIARDVGVVEATVRNVFADFIEQMEHQVHIRTPQWMALIDILALGHPRRRVPRVLVANAKGWTIVDILESRDDACVARYLNGLREPETVEFVGMGLSLVYRKAVLQALPGAVVFVDKPYVLAAADEALMQAWEAVRADLSPHESRELGHDRAHILARADRLQGNEEATAALHASLERFPLLGSASRVREALHAVYDAPISESVALGRMDRAMQSLVPQARQFFSAMQDLLEHSRAQLGAYFQHDCARMSVSALDDCSDLGGLIESLGRGHSFPAVRAKLLFPQRFPVIAFSTPGVGIGRLRRGGA